jgi:hypothetical protein
MRNLLIYSNYSNHKHFTRTSHDQVHQDVPLTFELLAISMNGVLVDILTYSLCLLEVWCDRPETFVHCRVSAFFMSLVRNEIWLTLWLMSQPVAVLRLAHSLGTGLTGRLEK